MTTDWSAFERKISIVGDRCCSTSEECSIVAKTLTDLQQLPPSYVEYVQRFGAGEWKPDLVIAVPWHAKEPLMLKYYLGEWTKRCERSGQPPKVRRLLPFGGHADGYYLCWDTDSLMNDGEMSVCLLEHERSQVIYCGQTLLQFLEVYWVGKKLDAVYPLTGGSWRSEPHFRAIC